MFTLGRAPGEAKASADPSALATDPFGRIRHELRNLGSSLDRFDARVKSALRKIPGSRMPPPRDEAKSSKAAPVTKPSLIDRLRNGAKGLASAASEPEKESRDARKEKTPPPSPASTKKGGQSSKKVPAAAPTDPAAGRPKSAPSKAQERENPPLKKPLPIPAKRPNAKTRAEEPEVRDYISRSYAPKDDGEAEEKSEKEETASSRLAKSASMPPRPPQKVTVADLDEADRHLVARARAAMAQVDPARASLAAAAAALVAAHVLAKAMRARRASRAAEEKDALDIDSAFGTPTRADASSSQRIDAAKEKAPALMPATGTPSAKHLVFGDQKATALQPADVNRAAPARASSSKQNRFGVGADALAAAVRAKTAVIKATRRLKRSGELRVDVLEATFPAPRKSESGSIPDAFSFRVAVDADGKDSIRGSTTARGFDDERKRDVVTFDQRLAFSLPASSDGHAGKRVEARLCDGEGRTVAKTALLLRAALRAAPVTKSFPLHDRAGAVFGTARLAVEWDYEKEEEGSAAKQNEAASAAAKFLAAVKK